MESRNYPNEHPRRLWRLTNSLHQMSISVHIAKLRWELALRGLHPSQMRECGPEQVYCGWCHCAERPGRQGRDPLTGHWDRNCPYCLGTACNLEVLRCFGASAHEIAELFSEDEDEEESVLGSTAGSGGTLANDRGD